MELFLLKKIKESLNKAPCIRIRFFLKAFFFFFFFFDVLVFRAQNDHQNATLCQTLSRVEDGFPLLV